MIGWWEIDGDFGPIRLYGQMRWALNFARMYGHTRIRCIGGRHG